VFSILDPQVCYSLPPFQIASGIADTFIHVMEQYLTVTGESLLMDRWAEGILSTLVEIAPKIMEHKTDYDLMANFMLCATMGLNGFIAMGVSQDWATHMIGHEITALHNTTHGQTLAIVFNGTIQVLQDQKREKLLQYGERVLNIKTGTETEKLQAIFATTEAFFKSLGLATRLSELNIPQSSIDEIEKRFNERGVAFGEKGNVTGSVAKQILECCF
jgi:NADP-dependent alcohol dehydrogenase